MRELAGAADQIAEGRYDVEIPDVPSGDEIGHLAERFREMAARLAEADERERNFLMSVSHELRTPLTAIRGHVDALREGVVEDPELASESLDVIAVEADRLSRLVGDILDLAKLDAHRFTLLQEEVDMEPLSSRRTRRSARRRDGARSTTGATEAQPVIVSDGDRVLQIISNLLSNAFRWTPDGGRIELELSQANGHDLGRGRRHGARDHGGGARADLPTVRVAGRRGARASGSRSRASSRVALGGRIDLESEPGQRQPLPARAASAKALFPAGRCGALRCGTRPRRRRLQMLLEPREPLVDALPAGGEEVDEQPEVVDARMSLGEHVAFEPLEPAERLVQQPAHLGELPADRAGLGARHLP